MAVVDGPKVARPDTIPAALDRQSEDIDAVSKAVAGLEDKLGLILGPVRDPAGEGGRISEGSASVLNRITDHTARLVDIHRHLVELSNRLQL